MCVQTTLFRSLQEAVNKAERTTSRASPSYADPSRTKSGLEWQIHIPEDGVILSPGVQVFRSGYVDGYRFLSKGEVVELAVISVAMPNCNRQVRDAPCDRPPDDIAYRELLHKKFVAMLRAAAEARVDTLIIPEAGCGVYMNAHRDVGEALGAALAEHAPEGLAVHLVGAAAFCEAVARGAEQVLPPPPPPSPPPTTTEFR